MKTKSKKPKVIKKKKESIESLIKKNPELAGMLESQGMHCANCPLARFETLNQGALVHRINPKKLRKPAKKATKRINIKKRS